MAEEGNTTRPYRETVEMKHDDADAAYDLDIGANNNILARFIIIVLGSGGISLRY